jgi:hypothetical protein
MVLGMGLPSVDPTKPDPIASLRRLQETKN